MASPEACWHVLYTKPRNKRKVAERLSFAGYTVYSPFQKVRRQWRDRIKVVEEPLFKGYLFIKIEEKKRDEVFTFPGAVRYLFWLRRPAVVFAKKKSTPFKSGWGSTITKISTSQR